MSAENWNRAYTEAPEIFDAFTRAEDPSGLVVQRLTAGAELSGSAVLEIGCGTGRYTAELAPLAGLYVAVERAPAMLDLARRRLRRSAKPPRMLCANAERLPLDDASFDQVVAAWVVLNLRPGLRTAVMAEIDRVVRHQPGAGVWLLENHWTGEFQAMRGRRGDSEQRRLGELMDTYNFRLVDVVETELRFPSAAEAERVLGYLCGETVRERLRCNPTATLTHNVVILHRGAAH